MMDKVIEDSVREKMINIDEPYKSAMEDLIKAVNKVGWKDFYYMILHLQVHNDTSYQLKK